MLFGFGWAKPVPIDPSYYKDQKTGIIWTSLQVQSLTFFWLLSFADLYPVVIFAPAFVSSGFGVFIAAVLMNTAVISIGFGIFNLIPIPPLDGAKIFWSFLPDREYYRMMAGSQWTTLLFILLIATGVLSRPLVMMRQTMLGWMLQACIGLIGLFI